MTNDVEFSRQRASVLSLGDAARAKAEHSFNTPILLTGETNALATENGRWALFDSARLLIRMNKQLAVQVLDNPDLAAEITALLNTLTRHQAVVTTTPVKYEGFEAILSIGSEVRTDLPWTTINSNGWSARVSS